MGDISKKSSAVSVEARTYGNKLYVQKNHNHVIHKNILLEFSKSIAFASKDTEHDLALAYGNRSALLLHLNQHEKCLLDIDRALKITKSGELKSKLETRKAKCLDAIQRNSNHIMVDINKSLKYLSINRNTQMKSQQLNTPLKLPGIIPSVNIPSASEAIVAKYNEKFGRHLVASRYIAPGEVIVAERGYVCFPIIKKRHLICSHCLSFAWNGISCDCCAFVIYCCETCKEDAWNEYHDVECSLLPFVPPSIFERDEFLPYLMVALRLLIKAIKNEGVDAIVNEFDASNSRNRNGLDGLTVEGQLRSDTFRSCVNLLSHQDVNKNKHSKNDLMISHLIESLFHRTRLFNLKGSRSGDNTKIISKMQIILKKLTDIVDDNVFEYQAFVCKCNSLSECRTTCDASRGAVLAPFSSLINHSCCSNVSRVCLPNGKVVMFTVAPVKQGEQLFASYGTLHTEEKEYRQQFLQKFFNFSCKCQACEENWPSDPQQAELQQNEEALIVMKIMIDFKKYFPSVLQSSVMTPSEDEWEFNEETLKHASKLSELTYKHFGNIMLASYYNLHYKNYMSTAFHTLYGENFAIPNDCY